MTTKTAWMESEIVPISALEHFSYCPRQCALIQVEQVYDENVFTLRGKRAHERADEPLSTTENGGVRVERALPLWSERLGLSGRADAVEFHPDGRVVPVEYKQGPRRVRRHDDVQVCAQALCLEEMLGVAVTEGAVFSVTTKRRRTVRFNEELREETEALVAETREALLSQGPLPPAPNDQRCPNCSLFDACLPVVAASVRAARLAAGLFTVEVAQ